MFDHSSLNTSWISLQAAKLVNWSQLKLELIQVYALASESFTVWNALPSWEGSSLKKEDNALNQFSRKGVLPSPLEVPRDENAFATAVLHSLTFLLIELCSSSTAAIPETTPPPLSLFPN
ncbi:hypothetical protein [Candidatus Mycoplasma haematominutum]|uniref:hypothetical protein n=1 Tax=Candidatus Mycoplasma haematominutum TaxID=209446 RepID=UPI00031A8025|nr:hypothetical protein [Candidatus Mycoplasma haematominutum]